MKFSIYTPTHNTMYIDRTYNSILEQTYKNWEWVIVLNNNAMIFNQNIINDERVKIINYKNNTNSIGLLKSVACDNATGDILVELDHDDILIENALEELFNAYSQMDVDFVSSDCANINTKWESITYNKNIGWETYNINYKNHNLIAMKNPDLIPQNISRIWYAPNHIRSWKKSFYNKIGGYNKDLNIADDLDLMLRTYIHGKMYNINKCLYIYWIDGNNSWLKYNEDVQNKQWNVYDKYIFEMAEKWSNDNNLLKIDLCGGIDKYKDYVSIDKNNSDIICDLNNTWCLQDNSVGLIRANDAIEHLKNPIHTMNEAYRVLADGGFFFIDVPSTDGKGAWCDPTHVSFWNDRSFRYYTEFNMRRYIEPDCNCMFLNVKTENIIKYDNLPYVRSHLVAVKNNLKIMGRPLLNI